MQQQQQQQQQQQKPAMPPESEGTSEELPPERAPQPPPRLKRKSADISNEGLATVEAIYFFYRELLTAKAQRAGGAYAGEVDDLLLLFALQHRKVQQHAQKK